MDGFLTQLLTMLGYQLPELLACVAGVAMLLMWAPAAPGRPLALAGTGLMLAAAVLRGAMSAWQAWLIHSAADGYASISGMMSLFGVVGGDRGAFLRAGLDAGDPGLAHDRAHHPLRGGHAVGGQVSAHPAVPVDAVGGGVAVDHRGGHLRPSGRRRARGVASLHPRVVTGA